jgi:hypothetical protein
VDKAAFMIKDADQDEDGLIYALKTLETEFGGYKDSESALVKKLAALEEMDINKPITIDNFKFSVIQLLRLITESGRKYEDHEQMILAHQHFEPQTRLLYESFRQSNRQQNNSLRLFFCWTRYHTNKMHNSMQSKAIMDDWRKPERGQQQPKQDQASGKWQVVEDKTLCAVEEKYQELDEDTICALRDALKSLCICCGKTGHKLLTCYKFDKLSMDERHALCEKEEVCKRCLRGVHPIDNCYKKEGCAVPNCGSMDHHAKLHKEDSNRNLNIAGGSKSKLKPGEKDGLMKQIHQMLKKIKDDEETTKTDNRADTVGLTADEKTPESDDICGFAHEENVDIGKLWRTSTVMMSMTKSFKAAQRSNLLSDEGSSATLLDTETSVQRGFKGKKQVQRITTVGNKRQTIHNLTGFIYLRSLRGGPIYAVKC